MAIKNKLPGAKVIKESQNSKLEKDEKKKAEQLLAHKQHIKKKKKKEEQHRDEREEIHHTQMIHKNIKRIQEESKERQKKKEEEEEAIAPYVAPPKKERKKLFEDDPLLNKLFQESITGWSSVAKSLIHELLTEPPSEIINEDAHPLKTDNTNLPAQNTQPTNTPQAPQHKPKGMTKLKKEKLSSTPLSPLGPLSSETPIFNPLKNDTHLSPISTTEDNQTDPLSQNNNNDPNVRGKK